MKNCEKVSKNLDKFVQPYVTTSGGVTVWRRIVFGFKESDVLMLRNDMDHCVQILTLAVTSANQ